MTTPFLSTQDLTDWLDKDVSNDEAAVMALDAACQAVRTYLQRDVNAGQETEILSGVGSRALVLSHWPVTEVTSVTLDGEALDPDEYRIERGGLLIRHDRVWPRGTDNVEVEYKHGWSLEEGQGTTVPTDIRMVALRMAQRLYTLKGESGGPKKSEKIGDYAYTLADGDQAAATGLTTFEMRMLDKYVDRRTY